MTTALAGLDGPRLRRVVGGVSRVRRLEILGTTGSTNEVARRLADGGAPDWTVVVANAQTAGHGRHGAPWHSPAGLGLYLSVLIRPGSTTAEITHWTLASALAACEACEDAGCAATIKWPNDVVHHGRKLAGTLASSRSLGSSVRELVIGTGFNVNHEPGDFPAELRDRATSLRTARGGAAFPREALAASYLAHLGKRLEQVDGGDGAAMLQAWKSRTPGAEGARVRVGGGEGVPFEGVTRGVEPSGALRVERLDDGSIALVHLGESLMPPES